MDAASIPFNYPFIPENTLKNLQQALDHRYLSGPGPFIDTCETYLQEKFAYPHVFLTHTATDALEMIALLLALQAGDQIIMPSFTHPSTANAFVLSGAVPVLVASELQTMNIDPQQIEQAITPKTKAIVIVHYAGVSCDIMAIQKIAQKHQLFLIEDASQAIFSRYQQQSVGRFGQMAVVSFHETKNIQCGEGGALIINDPSFVARADILYNKGTNRTAFFKGLVEQYSWVDKGSSYSMSHLNAAVLAAQFEAADVIQSQRQVIWDYYHTHLQHRFIDNMFIPSYADHNAHIYFFKLHEFISTKDFLKNLKTKGVSATCHYVPLHAASAGKKFTLTAGNLAATTIAARQLVRLPLWVGLEKNMAFIVENVLATLDSV